LVLCYAKYLRRPATHVAVRDTHDLENDVLIWHVPHLVSSQKHEYLAYGRIRGPGYCAVSLHDLEQHGLLRILKELRGGVRDMFGSMIRSKMFSYATVHLERPIIYLIKKTGSLFGALYFPVVTALVCLQPRVWRGWRKQGGMSGQWVDVPRYMAELIDALEISSVPVGLLQEPWRHSGMVHTATLSVVEQWINLMAFIAEHFAQKAELNKLTTVKTTLRAGIVKMTDAKRDSVKRKRDGSDGDELPRLRPLPERNY
jgi:hypothetical protein